MKRLLPFALFIFLSMPLSALAQEDTEIKETLSNTDTYAVIYYAEWCGSCKILLPKIDEAKSSLSEEVISDLEFVRFDFTDQSSRNSSKELAQNKNLLPLFESDAKTGQLKLIDKETGNVLGIIKKDLSADEIKGALTAITERL